MIVKSIREFTLTALISPVLFFVFSFVLFLPSAQASDNSGSIASISVKLDNGNSVTDTPAPYAANWNTAYSTTGTHTLMATAKDTVGNLKTTTITVTVAR